MQSTMSGWRAAADPDDLREYDRFGPWIDRVTEAMDMPRRFRPWWPELSAATYLLKVPRSYDRAQVRVGMDLYESVIAVFPDRLCFLRAEPSEIVRRDVARDEVVATVRHSNLLIGRWSLLLADGSAVAMEFNNVSHTTIAEVDRFLLRPDGTSEPVRVSAVRPTDHFFRSVVATLNAGSTEPVRPVHVEEPGRPCLTDRGRRRRSAGMMVLDSVYDLVIVDRDMPTKPRFRRANYASNVLRIPFRLMTGVEIRWAGESSPPTFSQLVITCGSQVITQPCLVRPDPVRELLTERGVPTTSVVPA
jgi:hypothetical protein